MLPPPRPPLPAAGAFLASVALVLGACGGGQQVAIAPPDDPPARPPAATVDPNRGDPDDRDQDGVGADDNCPGVFNPDQADDDNDGLGNPCDDDEAPIDKNACDLSGSLAGEATASGDTAKTTICQPMTRERPPWLAVGTIIFEAETYVLVDLSPPELLEARDLGLQTEPVDVLAGREPAELAELRLELDPAAALTTIDPAVLPDVRPEVVAEIPPEVLADQSDDTLRALPEEFWVAAPEATIERVGSERLAQLLPTIELPAIRGRDRGGLATRTTVPRVDG